MMLLTDVPVVILAVGHPARDLVTSVTWMFVSQRLASSVVLKLVLPPPITQT